ncbi:MAG: 1-acyl-sn-glycerol-3-phosphate acyltransferase [Desulfobacterales bacterium]|nr:1-acyl-sn-glycerol-3-phosphate acyltransferase [Desulfobacterales bacterium]
MKQVKQIWINFINKITNWISRLLKYTHNHFICYLPSKIGFLATIILKLFYSGIKVDKEQTAIIDNLKQDGFIVYATKYKSKFEYLLYYTRYKSLGLPFPQIGLDYTIMIWQPISHLFRIILSCFDYFCRYKSFPNQYTSGYIKEELTVGKSALVSIIDEKGFYRRFVKAKIDPVKYLIEIQKEIERPIFIVPQLVFYSRNPQKSIPTFIDILFGTEENPKRIRRLFMLFKKRGTIFFEVSEPVNLKKFMELPENCNKNTELLSLDLRRNLLSQFNRHRQAINGPASKSRMELKESILTTERFRSFIREYVKKNDTSMYQAYKKASGYFEEIAAKYSLGMIKLYDLTIRWISSTMFEGFTVNLDTLNKIKNMSQKGPLILVPCHKSHIDYLILSYIMFNNHMPCPLIAAGKNLSFWPMGPIFRGGGAFFLRRTFKGKELYSKVFKEYLYKILEEGFNIEFFIEGGRSRSGKLLTPKMGLLSMILDSYKNGACKDLIFVPIFIGYDRVMEESSYIHEIEGGQKQSESLSEMIKARKFIKKRYGKIYVNLGEPIDLNEHIQQQEISLNNLEHEDYNKFCYNLGLRFLNAIDNVSVVTPHALVASAILNQPKKRISYENIIATIDVYIHYLTSQEAALSDTLITDYSNAVDRVIDVYVHRKLIESTSWEKGSRSNLAQFKINENRRLILDYYKNNCIAHFVPSMFTSISILKNDAFLFSASDLYNNYDFLREFFKNEFAINVDKTSDFFIRKSIKAFIDEAILIPHQTLPNTFHLTAAGFRKLKLFASFLKPFFESYYIVLNFFKRYSQKEMETKDRLKKIKSIGERMYKRREIELSESLSKIYFQNADSYFMSKGLNGSDTDEKIKVYENAIQKYLNCLQV